MNILLAKIVADINEGRRTGVLTVLVKGTNHLLKLFFKDGNVYHITCGSLRDNECFASINTMEFGDCMFL